MEFSDSEEFEDPHESDESSSDWYDPNESDTGSEMPNPNLITEALFQDDGLLPEPLRNSHFQEGCIYSITMKTEKDVTHLGMVIQVKEETFLLRIFSSKGKKRKSFHDGADDKELRYNETWRLAPRNELMIPRNPGSIRRGQFLRFEYGNERYTITVVSETSRLVKGIVECGNLRGTRKDFEIIEIANIVELFASPLLRNLKEALKTLV